MVIVVEDLEGRVVFRGGSCAQIDAPVYGMMDHQQFLDQVVVGRLVPLPWSTNISKGRFGDLQHLMISETHHGRKSFPHVRGRLDVDAGLIVDGIALREG